MGSLIFTAMSRRPVAALNASVPPPTPAPPVLRLQRAMFGQSGSDGPTSAVSFDLAAGGAHVLTGESGSGKSVILRMIGLARTPELGALHLFGQDVAAVPHQRLFVLRRRIGMIFQDLKLVDGLSAQDNIALAAKAAGRVAEGLTKEIAEVLAWVGLGRRALMLAGDLPEDGRRRLALARAVINRPDLVVADEPAGRNGQALLALLGELNQAGTSILLATRDGALAANAGAEVTHLSRANPTSGRRA